MKKWKVSSSTWGEKVRVEDLVGRGRYEVKTSLSYLLEGLR